MAMSLVIIVMESIPVPQAPFGSGAIGFARLFQRTIAEKGSKVVHVRTSHKELEKRLATLVYVARAEGLQPPPIVVLAGKPCKEASQRINPYHTRLPASTLIKNEMKDYTKGVWVLRSKHLRLYFEI